MKAEWTREAILELPTRHRPKVRAITHDGHKVDAEITRDGNNAYVSHGTISFGCSWGLVLQVMNDPYESPIEFSRKPMTYTVPELS